MALIIVLLTPEMVSRPGFRRGQRYGWWLELVLWVPLWTGFLLLLDWVIGRTGVHGLFQTRLVGQLLGFAILVTLVAPAFWIRRRWTQRRIAKRRRTPHTYIPPCIEK